MADSSLLRSTLDAVDDLVGRLCARTEMAWTVDPRLVIDEGRAAAEWTLDLDCGDSVRRIGLLVVCDVSEDRLTDARLYLAVPPIHAETP
jgi:hypothetical protein